MNLKAFRTLARIIDKEEPEAISFHRNSPRYFIDEMTTQNCEDYFTLKKGNTKIDVSHYPAKAIHPSATKFKQKNCTILPEYFEVTRTTTDKQRVEIE